MKTEDIRSLARLAIDEPQKAAGRIKKADITGPLIEPLLRQIAEEVGKQGHDAVDKAVRFAELALPLRLQAWLIIECRVVAYNTWQSGGSPRKDLRRFFHGPHIAQWAARNHEFFTELKNKAATDKATVDKLLFTPEDDDATGN